MNCFDQGGNLVDHNRHQLEGTEVKNCWTKSSRSQNCQGCYSCRKYQNSLQNNQRTALTAEPSNTCMLMEPSILWPYLPLESHSKKKFNIPPPKRCGDDLSLKGVFGEEVIAPTK